MHGYISWLILDSWSVKLFSTTDLYHTQLAETRPSIPNRAVLSLINLPPILPCTTQYAPQYPTRRDHLERHRMGLLPHDDGACRFIQHQAA